MLAGNVFWLSVASFLNDASSEMIFPLLPVFLVGTLGAGPAFLGIVEGVAETTAAFVKLGGGWLSDRVRKRRALVGTGYGLAALTRPLMAAAMAPWHVLALRFTDRVGKGVRTAPRDALLAESVEPATRGRAFGLHRAADHAGAILGPVIAAGILLLAPGDLRLVFLLAAVPAALAVLAVVAKVREISPGEPAGNDESHAEADPATPFTDRRFAGYLLVLVIFTLGNASDAFLLLRAEGLGVPLAMVPILWSALHVSKMVFNVLGGALSDRFGPVPAILIGWLVYAATYLGFALADQPWHAWALFGVYGLFYGLTEPTEKALVASLAPSESRARAFGAYHFAIGVAALPASVIFGVVWETIGVAAAFGLGAALAVVAGVGLPVVVRGAR
ncbi:MAG: MFS transporter [Longimicrobiales bacterium]|nr:MFS transporter [Longimicrobiales bacterium]